MKGHEAVPAQLFRHLPSSGSSANAEHSWLEHSAPTAHHSQRFATHDPSPQTMGLAGFFFFSKNSWQEAESRSTLSIAGHPQGARCLPCCHRAACASEASWPRMTAMEADAGGAGWEACQMDCIPPSASVLFSSTSNLRPAPCFQCPQKNKKGVDRTGKVVYYIVCRQEN